MLAEIRAADEKGLRDKVGQNDNPDPKDPLPATGKVVLSGGSVSRVGTRTVFQVNYRVQGVLPPGRYHGTPIVAYESSSQLMDLRLEYVPLLVTGTRASGGIVDLPHELSWQRVSRDSVVEGAQ